MVEEEVRRVNDKTPKGKTDQDEIKPQVFPLDKL